MKTNFEKELSKNIKAIQKAITNLKTLKLNIELQETETMLGTLVNHVYVRDRLKEKIILQKYLFTL